MFSLAVKLMLFHLFQFPPPWTLSPIKGLKQLPKDTRPGILEINFSDNEDEEYKPTMEELEVSENTLNMVTHHAMA